MIFFIYMSFNLSSYLSTGVWNADEQSVLRAWRDEVLISLLFSWF